MKRSVLRIELIGIVVIFFLGSGFHFLFEICGEWPPVGAIAAVNESVFEHLKLTFWPAVIWAAVSYRFLRGITSNFFTARAVAVYIMPVVIIVLFYGYTILTGLENVFIDIGIFFVAVAAGQFVGYRILVAEQLPRWLTWLSLAFIIILALIYALFTYYPPHVPFFEDANTGGYGIQ